MKCVSLVLLGVALNLATSPVTAQEAFPATHAANLHTVSSVPSPLGGRGIVIFAVDRSAGEVELRITLVTPADTVVEVRVRKHTRSGDDPTLLVIPYPQGMTTVGNTVPVFDPAIYQALDSELVYLDLRSNAYPDGYMIGDVSMIPNVICGRFDGSMMVPPVAGTSGSAEGYMRADPARQSARYYVTWYGMSGAPVAVEIHRGRRDENGPLVRVLPAISGSNAVVGEWTRMTDADIMDLNAGKFYLVVTSAQFPNGEIRGQLSPMDAFTVGLDPANVVPPTQTSFATGTGLVGVQRFDDGNIGIRVNAVYGDFSDTITAAHLHRGASGTNGAAVNSLMVQPPGSLFADTNFAPGTMAPDLLADLRAGRGYLDIHSTGNADGEIRGQLIPSAPDLGGAAGVDDRGAGSAVAFTVRYSRAGRAFSYAADGMNGAGVIQLYSVTGAMVMERAVDGPEGAFPAALPAGLYLVRMRDAHGVTAVTRLMVAP